jgi:C_GCAxxG_C_C family probable redox protein
MVHISNFGLCTTNSKKIVMENRKEKALQFFQNQFNCAQAVFSALAEDVGMDEDTCLKISTSFGGGIARRQKVCGAVTGALMAIGAKHGKASGDTEEKKINTYRLSEEFMKAFEEKNGSIDCRDILGADMNTEEGRKIIEQENLFKVRCEKCVRDAVEIAYKYVK